MSDPYKEATRHERRRMPGLVKFLLVGGGILFASLAVVAVLSYLQFRKIVDDQWGVGFDSSVQADIEALADMIEEAVEEDVIIVREGEVEVGRQLHDSARDLERALADLQESVHVKLDGQQVRIDLSDLKEQLEETEAELRGALRDGIRIEAEGDDNGGRLVVRDGDGESIVEISGSDEGGSIRIRGRSRDARFRVGEGSADLPGWVPVHPDAEIERHVVTGETPDASYGLAVLRAGAPARDVFEWYGEELRGDAWAVSASMSEWGAAEQRGRMTARRRSLLGNEQSVMLLVSRQDGGETRVLLVHKRDR